MTSKERVPRNYHFQPVDRFAIDFCSGSKVYALLREYYGVPNDLASMERLHVDFRGIAICESMNINRKGADLECCGLTQLWCLRPPRLLTPKDRSSERKAASSHRAPQ
jgi:hypothetical protein